MTSSRSTQKITGKVIPKNERLEDADIKACFSKFHAFSIDYAKNSDFNPTTIIRQHATSHGLASAIIHAYTLHQHLRFSPDDVWLTVAQGVSEHIWKDPERFRYMFVDHQGQEEVFMDARDILNRVDGNLVGDWPQAITRLSDAADKRVEKDGLKQL